VIVISKLLAVWYLCFPPRSSDLINSATWKLNVKSYLGYSKHGRLVNFC